MSNKNLLEAMLHIGTVNPNYKMTAENIQELLECMEYGELDQNLCVLEKTNDRRNWTSLIHKFNFWSNKNV